MPDEKTHADSLRLHLSGAASDGGAQADPDASLGNYRSSTEVTHLGHSITNPIANVTIDYVSGKNALGPGTLHAPTADTLTWKAHGGSTGTAVTIANGETKIVEDGTDTNAYLRVSRTSADGLTGTATVTIVDQLNNQIGFDNITSAEAVASDDEYRVLFFKVDASSSVKLLKVWIGQDGTATTSSVGQLGASGAGTIQGAADCFSDWPDTGGCRIETSGDVIREIVYYNLKTSDTLTVPAAGRELLGTTAAAGANDDNLYNVPLIRIAKEAPSAQPSGYIQTIADEDTAPAAVSWVSGVTAATGVDIGTLATGYIQGLWIHRETPAGQVAEAGILHKLEWSFDTV